VSLFQFEIPTEATARAALIGRSYQDTGHHDALTCQRRLLPVTTPQERAEARAFVNGVSYPCASCGKHRFPTADVVCFWCRADEAELDAVLRDVA